MNLHKRIGLHLGWTEAMTKSFSMRALREVIRMGAPGKERDALLADIEHVERTGSVVMQQKAPPNE